MFKIIIISLLLWWWTYIKSEDTPGWRLIYSFTNPFMIVFLVTLLILGPIIHIYTASASALNAPSETPYFIEKLHFSLILALVLSVFTGIIGLNSERKRQKEG